MVSVIVTTRNSADTLEACLKSVRGQAAARTELIVVDNRSTDRTGEIALHHADHLEIAGPERSRQRNLGAQLSTGAWLLFLDSDMVLPSGVLDECLEASGPKAAAVIIPEVSKGEGYWAACKALERACYIGDDSIEAARFFPRQVFSALGGFDEMLTGEEDWDLTVRARKAGIPVARTTLPLVHDERALSLAETMRTKFYYGRTMGRYLRKHPRVAAGQVNIFRPAFIRQRGLLARHPGLAAGMLLMKGAEVGAGALGTLAGLWADRRR